MTKFATPIKSYSHNFFAILALMLAFFNVHQSNAQTVVGTPITYLWTQPCLSSSSTAQAYTYTVPAGINRLKVQTWGGGGAGSSDEDGAYAGGGGGAYAEGFINVTPGESINIRVGHGGYGKTWNACAGTNFTAGEGAASEVFTGAWKVYAGAGKSNNNYNGAISTASRPGGTTYFNGAVTSQVGYNGGASGACSVGQLLTDCCNSVRGIGGGGGGGGAACPSGPGLPGGTGIVTSGSDGIGGAGGGTACGGAAGKGGAGSGSPGYAPGISGTFPGGGGGGTGFSDYYAVNSGSGAAGQVIITPITVCPDVNNSIAVNNPSPVEGNPDQFCLGSSVTMTNTVTGGVWSVVQTGASPSLVINPTTGVVTAATPYYGGTASYSTIRYTVGSCPVAEYYGVRAARKDSFIVQPRLEVPGSVGTPKTTPTIYGENVSIGYTAASATNPNNVTGTGITTSIYAPGRQWQRSLDNGVTWQDINNGGDYTTFPNLIRITKPKVVTPAIQYRIKLVNACGETISNVITPIITPRQLTLTGTVANKPYDATTTATFTSTGFSTANPANEVVGTDVVSANITSVNFNNPTVGTSKPVTVNATLTGADAANYSIAPLTATADITPKALTITGAVAQNKTFDGTTAATVTGGVLSGVIPIVDPNLLPANWSGTFIGAPTFYRPVQGGGVLLPYAVHCFIPTTTGSYTFNAGGSAYDTYGLLYEGGFNPQSPGDWVMNADDNAGDDPIITYTCTAGIQYCFVLSPYNNDPSVGPYTIANSGPAQTVPPPSVVLSAPNATFNSATPGSGKPVTTAYTLTGADAANYTVIQPAGLTADISFVAGADGDGVVDALDADDDNDGINDAIEDAVIGGPDSDGDGVPNSKDLDSDNDGVTDAIEAGGLTTLTADPDKDGLVGTGVPATGATGVPTTGGNVTPIDSDGDGKPNFVDADADGDGITDVLESLFYLTGGADANNDGKVGTTFTDVDGDGLNDLVDPINNTNSTPIAAGAANVNNPLYAQDRDGDGKPNRLDADSDNDGIPDNIEGQSTSTFALPLGTDTDNDGIDNRYDINSGGTPVGYVNTDGGSAPDYVDLDADNDGTKDLDQNGVTSGEVDLTTYSASTGLTTPGPDGMVDATMADSDNDGLADIFETQTLANIPNTENAGTPEKDYRELSDLDGDGIGDGTDLDDDNDGIPDTVEGTADFDGDGKPNNVDLDSDNDGVFDIFESGNAPALAADINKDGKISTAESAPGTNGIPNAAETVADNGITPAPTNTDADANPNFIDNDSDGDGINDVTETGGVDLDGSGQIGAGIANDADADGIPDLADAINSNGDPAFTAGTASPNVDFDGDGITNERDLDSDNDGITDAVENAICTPLVQKCDFDNDGKPNYLDLDSDNDGISDLKESGLAAAAIAADANNDGKISNTESPVGADGIPNIAQGGTDLAAVTAPSNTDGATNADFCDTDADGDGIMDVVEAGGVAPTTTTDVDADGILDTFDPINNNAAAGFTAGTALAVPDTDGDGKSNFKDTDSDADGLLDSYENSVCTTGLCDKDIDAVPNYIDIDSDNDGISDLVESGNAAAIAADANTNGVITGAETPITPTTNALDTDGDGIANIYDNDSDGDGVSDLIESGITPALLASLDVDNNGVIDPKVDTDLDGIPDVIDGSASTIGDNTPPVLANADGDAVNNYLDADSDNDGITDAYENSDCGTAICDEDGDGIPSYLDLDSDNDGISDLVEAGVPAFITADANGNGTIDGAETAITPTSTPVDTDGDTFPNAYDNDSDGDGISDLAESGLTPAQITAFDADGDGKADFGADTDGDGILNTLDGTPTLFGDNTPPTLPDTDGNTIKDYIDAIDTDGDGIADATDTDDDADGIADLEDFRPLDTDNDGTPNNTDTDDDGDGIADAMEPTQLLDSDNDNIPNATDTDDDNDGVLDTVEYGTLSAFSPLPDVDGDGKPDLIDVIDTDGDGLPDNTDTDDDADGLLDTVDFRPLDTDNDGINNATDTDDDGDGIADAVEIGALKLDTDNDSIPNTTDLDDDGDGIPDATEQGTLSNTVALPDADGDGLPDLADAIDTDGDGFADIVDIDDDADGIDDNLDFRPLDTDNDGTNNATDTDDDGDGIADAAEPAAALDTDNDGMPNTTDLDDDNDGITDLVEEGTLSSTVALPDGDGDGLPDLIDALDTDGDGIADNTDNDDDADGIFDSVDFLPLDTDNDNIPNADDSDDDGDGIADATETAALRLDTDNDNIPNTTDDDDDNDGILDIDEDGTPSKTSALPDADADGIPDIIDQLDTDGDGVADVTDTDDDGDGIADAVDFLPLDTDNDNTPNATDTDDDGDGILDAGEAPGKALDTDNDGTPNATDTDDDNDGVLDAVEIGTPSATAALPDTDGDSIPDLIDLPDTDGDGIVDATDLDDDADGIADYQDYLPLDTDNDGTPNTTDTDDDGDGTLDTAETAALRLDTDNDNTPNATDTDDDNDGVLDYIESGVLSATTALPDTDLDGIPDLIDVAVVPAGPIDLVPVVSSVPNSLVGVSTFNTFVDITEVANTPTTGTTTVRITKDPKVTITFNATATLIGTKAVNNANWTFDGASDPNYYILTNTGVIPANATTTIGLDCSLNPTGQSGTITQSSIIINGNAVIVNDADADIITYFIN
jgi:hypothetical protein